MKTKVEFDIVSTEINLTDKLKTLIIRNEGSKYIVTPEFFVANWDLEFYDNFLKTKVDFLFEHPLHEISLEYNSDKKKFEFKLYLIDEKGALDIKNTKYHCFNEEGFLLEVAPEHLCY